MVRLKYKDQTLGRGKVSCICATGKIHYEQSLNCIGFCVFVFVFSLYVCVCLGKKKGGGGA